VVADSVPSSRVADGVIELTMAMPLLPQLVRFRCLGDVTPRQSPLTQACRASIDSPQSLVYRHEVRLVPIFGMPFGPAHCGTTVARIEQLERPLTNISMQR
jgi:hypothetical protein